MTDGKLDLLITSPVYKQEHPAFLQALDATFQALGQTFRFGPDPANPSAHIVRGDADIVRARAVCLAKFLEMERPWDFWLMVDSDLSWHPSVLERMLSRDLPFLTAAYAFKARAGFKKGLPVCRAHPGTEPDAAGLVRVNYCGGGFNLMRRDFVLDLCRCYPELAFTTNPDGDEDPGRPTFDLWLNLIAQQEPWEGGRREHLSEDYAFCHRAAALGYEMLIDHYAVLVHWDEDGVAYRTGEEPVYPEEDKPKRSQPASKRRK